MTKFIIKENKTRVMKARLMNQAIRFRLDLHTAINSETFEGVLSNTQDFAISRFVAAPPPTATCLDNVVICSYNCFMITGQSGCQLISYGGSGNGNDSVRGGRVDNDCSYVKRTDSALDSASNSYSKTEEILVGDSRYSSCPAYTVY